VLFESKYTKEDPNFLRYLSTQFSSRIDQPASQLRIVKLSRVG